MLVMTRKVGEKIRIGNSVYVQVLRTAGGRVRIGIEAPRGLEILRDELDNSQTSGRELQLAVVGQKN